MSTSSNLDRICAAALALAVLIAALAFCAPALGYEAASGGVVLGYEERLFDTSVVHTIDIVMDDWEGFIAGCEDEEYVLCDLVIDGEEQPGAGIRAKGNTSLSSVAAYGNDRYSFKIEFDHYDSSLSYYGLDKLNLNNIIQDNTYMKDFLSYQLMAAAGAAAPLCSYVWITVNGEDWGLYLAVEGVVESFLLRNYGTDYGELYKPDSMEMGGGRGNGGGFDMDQFQERFENDEFSLPEGTDVPGEGEFSPPEGEEMPAEGGFDRGEGGFGGRGGMGGENIAGILQRAPWTADGRHTLLLEPHSRAEVLRAFLAQNGYAIRREALVRDRGFLYPVMEVTAGEMPLSPGQIYCGAKLLHDPLGERYIIERIIQLQGVVAGKNKSADPKDRAHADQQRALITELLAMREEWRHVNGTGN